MNKIVFILASSVVAISCMGRHTSESQTANVSERAVNRQEISGDTIGISLSDSKIFWKGTKMCGAGKHEGEISLKSGYFISHNGQLKGGEFSVDMQTLEVTDIPETDPIPRNNLKNHLKGPDFFEVEKFPYASFQITEIKDLSADSIKVSGNLTIKDIVKAIEFRALNSRNTFSSTFTFDRFEWNIAYEGSWADRTFVDKDVELTIEIVME